LCSHSRKSHHLMEPEGSLPCSQEPSTGPYPEPDQSTPHYPILSQNINLTIIFYLRVVPSPYFRRLSEDSLFKLLRLCALRQLVSVSKLANGAGHQRFGDLACLHHQDGCLNFDASSRSVVSLIKHRLVSNCPSYRLHAGSRQLLRCYD
jgi:hypothetical protein